MIETLSKEEVSRVLKLVPRIVLDQIAREGLVLAGGCIRDTVANLPVKDLDIFCHSAEQAERLALEASSFVKQSLFAYSVELECPAWYGWNIPVQYVFYKEYKDPEELISQFDFRACCAGIVWDYNTPDYPDWYGLAVSGFHADCEAKRLTFMSQLKDAGKLTALGRALTLAAKGWKLPTSEAARIVTHFDPTITVERAHYAFRPGYGGAR